MKKLKKIKLLSEHSEAFEPPCEDGQKNEVGRQEPENAEGKEKFMKRLGKIRPRVKPFPWKTVFSGRNMLIASCIAVIVLAGYLNIRFYSPEDASAGASAENTGNPEISVATEGEDYFAVAVMNRERVRDEALDTLRSVAESETAGAEEKQQAYDAMNRLADQSTYEVNIENLVRAKGFSECVAVVGDGTANVIVGAPIEDLGEAEVAQIKEIVYLESGVLPTDIKIIQKNS